MVQSTITRLTQHFLLPGLFLAATFGALAQELTIDIPDGEPLPVPFAPGSAVVIDPASGNLTVTTTSDFVCLGTDSDCQVSLAAADGSFFTINGSTSPVEVVENSSVTINWRARGAWECSGTGDLVGTNWNQPGKLPFGPQTVSLAGLSPGNYSVGLTCENGPAEPAVASPVTIAITPSSIVIPEGCQGRQPNNTVAAEVCRNNFPSTDCLSYGSLFGTPFPGNQQGKEFFQLRDTYTTLKFNTDNLTASSGTWQFLSPQFGNRNSGPRITTISKCPGDFDKGLIDAEMGPGCYWKTNVPPFSGDVSWARPGQTGGTCTLPVGEEFYLNIFYATQPGGTAPADLEWSCGDEPSVTQCENLAAPQFQ